MLLDYYIVKGFLRGIAREEIANSLCHFNKLRELTY